MIGRRILPNIVDELVDDARDAVGKEKRHGTLQILGRLNERARLMAMPDAPPLPGLHLFTGSRGAGVSLAAGRWALLNQAKGRTVISIGELLYGYCPDEPVLDFFNLLAQAPDNCVLHLDEPVAGYVLCRNRAPAWSNTQIEQVIDDATDRGITVLYVPIHGARLRDAAMDKVRWQHSISRPALPEPKAASLPNWCRIEERVFDLTASIFSERDNEIPNPAGGFTPAQAMAVAATQCWTRPALVPERCLDPDDAIDLGALHGQDTYDMMVSRFQSRLDQHLETDYIQAMNWGTLLRKVNGAEPRLFS